jgi:nitrite reductase/ring-hydroxylating ferredoxin subunit
MARDPSRTADACGACALNTDRRDFLAGSARALAALALLGVLPRRADALVAHNLTARAAKGQRLSYPIPAADGVSIDREHEVIVARHAGVLYAFALSCPHQHTALRWLENEARFQCPKHKSRYQPDGVFISGRATRGMDRFAVRAEGDALSVDLDTLYRQDQDPAGWGGAKVVLAPHSPSPAD